MKENKRTACDPCEQDFKKKVDELVHEGHAPTTLERMKRSREVHEAFGHATQQHGAAEEAEHKR